MSRVHEAMRRAAAEAGRPGTETERPGTESVILGRDPADAPFMSPWEFEEPFEERPAEPNQQAPLTGTRPRVSAADRPPLTTPAPRPTSAPPHVSVPAAGPESTSARPPRSGIPAAIPLESLMAMNWPQPFAPDVTGKLVATPGTSSVAIEQYRQLAARMIAMQAERGTKVLFVTSPRPGAGKSLTAANLGLCLAEPAGRRVLLVDANARRPGLHPIFQVSAGRGMAGGLVSAIELTQGLALLPGGRGSADPAAALDIEVMRPLLNDARAAYDWVIVEAPATAESPGLRALADLTDVTLLVIEPGKTAARDAEEAVDLLGRDRLAGLILNRVSDAFAQQGLDAGAAAR